LARVRFAAEAFRFRLGWSPFGNEETSFESFFFEVLGVLAIVCPERQTFSIFEKEPRGVLSLWSLVANLGQAYLFSLGEPSRCESSTRHAFGAA